MKFGAVCTILTGLGFLSAAQVLTDEPAPDPVEIVRKSLERNANNDARLKDYTFTESKETHTLEKDGTVVKTERESFDVVNLYGRPYKRRVSKDGLSLEGREKQKADEEFEKEVRKRESEGDDQRRKREEEHEKSRVDSLRYLLEIPKAYTFKISGEEVLDGMPVWVIEATPRPDFRSPVKRAELLKKVAGRIWVDKESLQWVRADVEAIEPISFGGFLAKLDRGARMTFLQTRVNDDVWLPLKATVRIDARLLVKHYRIAGETTWSNYRKFRVDSRVVEDAESPAPQPQK